MTAPTPFLIRTAAKPRLARKLRRLLEAIERENVDLVPTFIVGPDGSRRIVLMYADDCGWIRTKR